jgi:FtsH-binding integral membrane protein
MNARSRNIKVPIGPLVAAIGAVLLIVSLFLDWYEADLEAFTVYEVLDLLLVLMAVATIASLAGGLGVIRAAPSPGVSLAVALFTVFVVLSQVLNDPPAVANGEAGKEIGIWLALAGAALMVAGSVLAYAHISVAIETRARATVPNDNEDATRPLDDPEAPSRPA